MLVVGLQHKLPLIENKPQMAHATSMHTSATEIVPKIKSTRQIYYSQRNNDNFFPLGLLLMSPLRVMLANIAKNSSWLWAEAVLLNTHSKIYLSHWGIKHLKHSYVQLQSMHHCQSLIKEAFLRLSSTLYLNVCQIASVYWFHCK